MFRKKIITRFAPSPTGFMHVGNLRTALYSYLFAKHHHGKFLLRIEDTDQARTVAGAAEGLQKTLKIFGLEPDSKSPMVQSTRLAVYQKAAEKLVSQGKAYYCFCDKSRLEKLKLDQEKNKQAPMYDGYCKTLNQKDIENNLKENKPRVIRFIIPDSGKTTFSDLIRGEVNFENKLIDDQIIIKSDGFPTYHLASVVDDHDMKVTHVIRGEDWLSSTPKHILLYQALGYKLPQFAHLPLLLNADKSKLSKRQGDVAAEDFLAKGYLPAALLNFILLLGWNPGTDQEIFNLKDMVRQFNLEKVNKSGAIFNLEKLDWLNGYYIRQTSPETLTALTIPYLVKAGLITPEFKTAEANSNLTGYLGKTIVENIKIRQTNQPLSLNELTKIIKIHQDKIKKLEDMAEEIKYIFILEPYQPAILIWKSASAETTAANLEKLSAALNGIDLADWSAANLEKVINQLIQATGQGKGDILFPMRAALTGKKASPGPFDVAAVLGKDQSIKRLNRAIVLLKKIEK